MAENANIVEVVDERANLNTVVDDLIPAPGAEENKPKTPPEGEAPPEVVEETTEQQEAKKQSKFQRRLDRQKSARVAAETEARLLRERLEKLEAQPKAQQEAGEPKRDDFPDYEAYLRAVTRYDAAQESAKTLKADREERSKRERDTRASLEQETLAKSWNERETAFQKTAPDYLEKAIAYTEEDLGDLSSEARRAIIELGPQVLHHLASNPDVHERIAALSPLRQVAELGKLDVPQAAPVKKASAAPAPAKTTNGGRSTAAGYRDDMTDTEYQEWRKSQGATWAQR